MCTYLTVLYYLGIPADHLPNLGTGKHERNQNNNNNNNNPQRTTTTEQTTGFRKLTTGKNKLWIVKLFSFIIFGSGRFNHFGPSAPYYDMFSLYFCHPDPVGLF